MRKLRCKFLTKGIPIETQDWPELWSLVSAVYKMVTYTNDWQQLVSDECGLIARQISNGGLNWDLLPGKGVMCDNSQKWEILFGVYLLKYAHSHMIAPVHGNGAFWYLCNRPVHISVTNWCIVGYWIGAFWYLCKRSVDKYLSTYQSNKDGTIKPMRVTLFIPSKYI